MSAALTPSARASSQARARPPTTVANAMPRAVWAWGSKKISARTTFCRAALVRYAQARSKKSCSVRSTLAPA